MNTERPPFPPILALVGGLFAVSTGAIFFRLAEAPALVESFYRCALATLLLLPFAWARVRGEWWRLPRLAWGLAAIAGFFLALHFATWTLSLNYTTVASSTVLVTTNPVWVGLLTPFISSDRLSRLTVLGIALSVTGGIVIGWGDFQVGGKALLGDGLAILGAISAAVYLLVGRRLRQTLSLLAYIVLCYGAAALILLALVLLFRLPLAGYTVETYGWLLAVAVVPQVLGHSSFNWGLRWFSASLIAVTLLGEPILSTIWAFLFLGERVPPTTLWGGAIILAGIFFAIRGEAGQPVGRGALEAEPVS